MFVNVKYPTVECMVVTSEATSNSTLDLVDFDLSQGSLDVVLEYIKGVVYGEAN
jgi:hypothetical protein